MTLNQQIEEKIRQIDVLNERVVTAKHQDLPWAERLELIRKLAQAKDELAQLQLQHLNQLQNPLFSQIELKA